MHVDGARWWHVALCLALFTTHCTAYLPTSAGAMSAPHAASGVHGDFAHSSRAAGGTVFVAPGGTGHACTSEAPCGTLRHAIDTVGWGGVVVMREGVYTGSNNTDVIFHGDIEVRGETGRAEDVLLRCGEHAAEARRGWRCYAHCAVSHVSWEACNVALDVDSGLAEVVDIAVRNSSGPDASVNVLCTQRNCNVLIDGLVVEDSRGLHGGALYVGSSSQGDMVFDMRNSVFRRNIGSGTTGGDGGAVLVQSVVTPDTKDYVALVAHVSNCTFEDNFSSHRGGGMAMNSVTGSYGAVAYLHTRVHDCRFRRNHADLSGGGYAVVAVGEVGHLTLALNDTLFVDNESQRAGALDVNNAGGTAMDVVLHRVRMYENQAQIGGGMRVQGQFKAPKVHMYDCDFAHNLAQGHWGGALASSGTVLVHAVRSRFAHNTAVGGGAVLAKDVLRVEFTDCYFERNYAKFRAGALLATAQSSVYLVRTNFTLNVSGGTGGVLDATGVTNVDITGGYWFNNTVGTDGGCMALTETSSCTVRDLEAESCTAPFAGGFALVTGGATLTITNSVIRHAEATLGGFVSITQVATLTAAGCHMYDGRALDGAILNMLERASASVSLLHAEGNQGLSIFYVRDKATLELTTGAVTGNEFYRAVDMTTHCTVSLNNVDMFRNANTSVLVEVKTLQFQVWLGKGSFSWQGGHVRGSQVLQLDAKDVLFDCTLNALEVVDVEADSVVHVTHGHPVVSNCTFTNNDVSVGVVVADDAFTLDTVRIADNRGTAITFTRVFPATKCASVVLTDVRVGNNHSPYNGGGGVFFDLDADGTPCALPALGDKTMLDMRNNSGVFGMNTASTAYRLTVHPDAVNATSGFVMPSVDVFVMDYFNNVVNLPSSVFQADNSGGDALVTVVQASDEYTLSGQTLARCVGGESVFASLSIELARPGDMVMVEFEAPGLHRAYVRVHSRLCEEGRGMVDGVCAKCDSGTFSNATAFACEPCPIGQAQPVSGQQQCRDCDAGTFSDERGLMQCKQCHIGTAIAGTGSSTCAPCPHGHEAALRGMPTCTLCDRGYVRNSNTSLRLCTPCTPGTTHNDEHTECVCPVGTYAAGPAAEVSHGTECVPCPDGAVCTAKGLTIATFPTARGYWRAPSTARVLRCGSESQCLGASGCGSHHTGTLCSLCKDGYSKLNDLCTRCPPRGVSIVLIVVVGMAMMGMLVYLVQTTNRRSERTHMIKLMLTFAQQVSLIHSMHFHWPQSSNWGTAVLHPFLSFSIPTVGCVLDYSYYDVAVAYYIMPVFAVLLVVAVTWLSWRIRFSAAPARSTTKRRAPSGAYVEMEDRAPLDEHGEVDDMCERTEQEESVVDGVVRSIAVTTFLLHPAVVGKAFGMFPCVNLGNGTRVLAEDVALECDTASYYAHVSTALMVLVVFGVGTLAVAFYYTWKARTCASAVINYRLGFIMDGYRCTHCYYEVVLSLRKMALVAVTALIQQGRYQFFVAAIVLVLSLVVDMQTRPFKNNVHNTMLITVTTVCLINAACGYVYYFFDNGSSHVYTGVLLVLVNAAVFLFIISHTVRHGVATLKQRGNVARREGDHIVVSGP